MATIIHSQKALAVNPLKVSQPMGATLAFLGVARAMPLMHGAQGCTAFGKVFFANHFREPIPLQTTAMDQVASILGADDSVLEALRTFFANERPEAIGLLTTGLPNAERGHPPQHLGISQVLSGIRGNCDHTRQYDGHGWLSRDRLCHRGRGDDRDIDSAGPAKVRAHSA